LYYSSVVGGKVDIKPSLIHPLKSSIAADVALFSTAAHFNVCQLNGINVGTNGDALSAGPARKYAFAEAEWPTVDLVRVEHSKL
jgi:hypothetical protein